MPQKLGSISYQVRPWRAETGKAWWLLCHPSPPVSRATHQLLRESSRVSKRREPHIWVAELTSHVTWSPRVTRRKTAHKGHDHPPTASRANPITVTGSQ